MQLLPSPRDAPSGASLDELMGPAVSRPGELHERVAVAVPPSLKLAASEVGVSVSLAVAVVAERALVAREVSLDRELVVRLDSRAQSPGEVALSAAAADYARMLVAALNGRLAPQSPDAAVVVIPTRLADRLRAAKELDLSGSLSEALSWELAAVRAGRTMTEWALGELLASYPLSAARQDLAAAAAAR